MQLMFACHTLVTGGRLPKQVKVRLNDWARRSGACPQNIWETADAEENAANKAR